MIELEEGTIQVDAATVAYGLVVEQSIVQKRMHEGTITSLYERNVSEDAGCHRLTFFSENRGSGLP